MNIRTHASGVMIFISHGGVVEGDAELEWRKNKIDDEETSCSDRYGGGDAHWYWRGSILGWNMPEPDWFRAHYKI